MAKVISLIACYLGATKQLPFLLREFEKFDSSLPLRVVTYDYTGTLNVDRILDYDLKKEGINLKNLKIYDCYFGKALGVEVYLSPGNFDLSYFHKGIFSFSIDPLKFENRKLLTDIEINSLKQSYFLMDKKIVLVGSIHQDEFILMEKFNEIIFNCPSVQFMLVPRGHHGFILDYFKINKIKYRLDREENFNSNYCIITEKGILDKLYSICDIAIVGDSFRIGGGGQNPLEPAFYGKRIISGKYNLNNQVAYDGLEKSGLLKRIEFSKLTDKILKIPSEKKLNKFRKRANKFIEFNQGAGKVYAEIIYDAFREKITQEEVDLKLNSLNFYRQDRFEF